MPGGITKLQNSRQLPKANICQRYARSNSKTTNSRQEHKADICHIYSKDISGVIIKLQIQDKYPKQRCAKDMPKIYQRYAKYIPKVFQRLKTDMVIIIEVFWTGPIIIMSSIIGCVGHCVCLCPARFPILEEIEDQLSPFILLKTLKSKWRKDQLRLL